MQRLWGAKRNLQFGISCLVFGLALLFKQQCCKRGLNTTASSGGLDLTNNSTAGIQAHFCSSCLVKAGNISYLDSIQWLWMGSATWSNEVWLHAYKITPEEIEIGEISEKESNLQWALQYVGSDCATPPRLFQIAGTQIFLWPPLALLKLRPISPVSSTGSATYLCVRWQSFLVIQWTFSVRGNSRCFAQKFVSLLGQSSKTIQANTMKCSE